MASLVSPLWNVQRGGNWCLPRGWLHSVVLSMAIGILPPGNGLKKCFFLSHHHLLLGSETIFMPLWPMVKVQMVQCMQAVFQLNLPVSMLQ